MDDLEMKPGMFMATMRKLLAAFAEDFFNFFSRNAKAWQRNMVGPLPLYDLFTEEEYPHFKSVGRKAVVTLAYLLRHEYRKNFQEIFDALKNGENYENYVMSSKKKTGDNHLDHFLAWIAFLLELTTYCYTQGYDYRELGQQCLMRYPEIGWHYMIDDWEMFHDRAKAIAVFYDPLITSFNGKFPESDVLAPFLKALNDISSLFNYEGKLWEALFTLLGTVYSYDQRNVRFAYFITKNEYLDKSKERRKVWSPKSDNLSSGNSGLKLHGEKEGIMSNIWSQIKDISTSGENEPTQLQDKTGLEAGNEPIIVSAVLNESQCEVNDPGTCTEFDHTNTLLVIMDRCLEKKRNEMKKDQKPKCKFDIKVYLPLKTDKIGINVIEKLYEDFEDNIDENNVLRIDNNRFIVVGPPGWKDKCNDYRLIVLHSLSDEEEKFDCSQHSVMLHMFNTWLKFGPYSTNIIEMLIETRIWEAKFEIMPRTSGLSYENVLPGAQSAAAKEVKAPVQLSPGSSKTHTADDLSSEVSASDSQTSARRKIRPGEKREWRKKSVKRN